MAERKELTAKQVREIEKQKAKAEKDRVRKARIDHVNGIVAAAKASSEAAIAEAKQAEEAEEAAKAEAEAAEKAKATTAAKTATAKK